MPLGNITSILVANNTTATVIKAGPGQVIAVEGYNNGTTQAYIKIYNATSATAGSGTPQARYFIPGGANANQALPLVSEPSSPDIYTTGITVIVTTGYADNDTGAPAASQFIVNIHWA